MYCPEHLIVKNKFMIICFYDCADIRWKYIPWKRKYNPLRCNLQSKKSDLVLTPNDRKVMPQRRGHYVR